MTCNPISKCSKIDSGCDSNVNYIQSNVEKLQMSIKSFDRCAKFHYSNESACSTSNAYRWIDHSNHDFMFDLRLNLRFLWHFVIFMFHEVFKEKLAHVLYLFSLTSSVINIVQSHQMQNRTRLDHIISVLNERVDRMSEQRNVMLLKLCGQTVSVMNVIYAISKIIA